MNPVSHIVDPAENRGTSPPDSFDSLKALLIERSDDLPPRLRQCSRHALDEPEQMAFGTVAEIAASAGVQPSALVRFAQTLGYSGFSEMQRVFRARLVDRAPDQAQRLGQIRRGGDTSAPTLLLGFAERARQSIQSLERDIDVASLTALVTRLSDARRIHLMGLRRSFPVVSYLYYVMGKLGIDAALLDGVGGVVDDRAQFLGEDDVLLVVSFQPYAPEVLAFAGRVDARDIPVVTITDSALSPIARIAETAVEIRESEMGGFRSMSATLCLALTIAVAVGEARDARIDP